MKRDQWLIKGATKDRQSITADWQPTNQKLIAGVVVRETRNVPKAGGYLTEIYRADWHVDDLPVAQLFQVVLTPGALSAWHAHQFVTDRLFVNQGLIRIVLYDTRPGSPTRGLINEFKFGTVRPALVVVPPQVWHGIQNLGPASSSILNLVDQAYSYEDPDHWRLPPDTGEIPFRFAVATGARTGEALK